MLDVKLSNENVRSLHYYVVRKFDQHGLNSTLVKLHLYRVSSKGSPSCWQCEHQSD